jgi:hypothetical protein
MDVEMPQFLARLLQRLPWRRRRRPKPLGVGCVPDKTVARVVRYLQNPTDTDGSMAHIAVPKVAIVSRNRMQAMLLSREKRLHHESGISCASSKWHHQQIQHLRAIGVDLEKEGIA